MNRRSGFTLLELLVVVAIIAILIALLLPAIQSIRERARSTYCANNLMQIGMALANYASVHSVLPPGVVDVKGPVLNVPSGYHHSWTVQILPFLGLENIYRHIDINRGVYDESNQTVLDSTIATFLCPSNPLPGQTNYAGCHNDVEAAIDADNKGVLYLNSHIRLDEIPDGTSHTILAGELKRATPSFGWSSGTRSSLRNTGSPINAKDPVPTTGFGSPGTSPGRDFAGVQALTEQGVLALDFVGGYSAWHPDGANFLLCDGSARFLKHSIDTIVYRRLGNRSDGEVVGDDAY